MFKDISVGFAERAADVEFLSLHTLLGSLQPVEN